MKEGRVRAGLRAGARVYGHVKYIIHPHMVLVTYGTFIDAV